jgi:hypothetical protein
MIDSGPRKGLRQEPGPSPGLPECGIRARMDRDRARILPGQGRGRQGGRSPAARRGGGGLGARVRAGKALLPDPVPLRDTVPGEVPGRSRSWCVAGRGAQNCLRPSCPPVPGREGSGSGGARERPWPGARGGGALPARSSTRQPLRAEPGPCVPGPMASGAADLRVLRCGSGNRHDTGRDLRGGPEGS